MKRLLLLPFLLLLGLVGLYAQQIDTITIHSQMGHDIKNIVILPQGYAEGDTRYPVVYLLHGHGDNHTCWINIKPELPQIASQYGFIVVCPDGKRSWYWDSPLHKDMQFETYISDELVHYIDSHYRTVADRRARAIAGLSMGGHGAMWNAIRHRDVFGAAGSTSGGGGLRPLPHHRDMKEPVSSTHPSLPPTATLS